MHKQFSIFKLDSNFSEVCTDLSTEFVDKFLVNKYEKKELAPYCIWVDSTYLLIIECVAKNC